MLRSGWIIECRPQLLVEKFFLESDLLRLSLVHRELLSLSASKRLLTFCLVQSSESAAEASVSEVTSDFPNMSGTSVVFNCPIC